MFVWVTVLVNVGQDVGAAYMGLCGCAPGNVCAGMPCMWQTTYRMSLNKDIIFCKKLHVIKHVYKKEAQKEKGIELLVYITLYYSIIQIIVVEPQNINLV